MDATARDWFTQWVKRELGKRNRQISSYQIQMSGSEVQDSELESKLKLVSKQTNKQVKPAFFFLFQDHHHQLEVITPLSFYPPSFYPSKLFVSFLIYIMSCSLLTTPFIRFLSTLSSPANINITTTSFDTATGQEIACIWYSNLHNLGFYSVCPASESLPAASLICVSHFLCLYSIY